MVELVTRPQILRVKVAPPALGFLTRVGTWLGMSATNLHVGQSARFQNKTGVIRFVGRTDFADGIWVGIEFAFAGGAREQHLQSFPLPLLSLSLSLSSVC